MLRCILNFDILNVIYSRTGLNFTYTDKKKYWPGRDFSEANFDGFGQFSQKVLKIQKFYIPHWKALVSSFQKLYQHRVWLPPKNRYAPLNESLTVFTQKGVADK